jgi:hypothetical protein
MALSGADVSLRTDAGASPGFVNIQQLEYIKIYEEARQCRR